MAGTEVEDQDMLHRIESLESRMASTESNVNTLMQGHSKLEKADENIWVVLREITSKMDTQNQSQTETNVKVEGLTNNVSALRTEFATKSGEQQAVLQYMTEQNKELLGVIKEVNTNKTELAKGEQAVTVEEIKSNTEKVKSFWTWFTQVFTVAAAIITAIGMILK